MAELIDLSFWNNEWMAEQQATIVDLIGERSDNAREARRIEQLMFAAKSDVRDGFCRATGWRLHVPRWSTLADLTSSGAPETFRAPVLWNSALDHAQCFTKGEGRGPGDRMAIVHNYSHRDPLDLLRIRDLPFASQKLPWSWYYPGDCVAWAIVATRGWPALKQALSDG